MMKTRGRNRLVDAHVEIQNVDDVQNSLADDRRPARRTERESGETLAVLGRQLDGSLPDAAAGLVVAYEPVWAIGTGLTPTAADVAEAHAFIRKKLTARYGTAGGNVRILYGGSVNQPMPRNSCPLPM